MGHPEPTAKMFVFKWSSQGTALVGGGMRTLTMYRMFQEKPTLIGKIFG
jgi:hypothetical protein